MPPKFELPSPMAPCVTAHPWAAKVDIKDCFLNFRLTEEFSLYFGFTLNLKQYKFNVLPFGWNMSPYLVTKFLRPLHVEFERICPKCSFFFYLDDILITGPTFEDVGYALMIVKDSLTSAGL